VRIQAQASRLHAYQGIGLFVWHPETGAFLQHDIEGAPSYDKVPDGDYNPPTAVLDEQAAQVLANSLWDAGIRPEGARARWASSQQRRPTWKTCGRWRFRG
jgi:hypothetical protein